MEKNKAAKLRSQVNRLFKANPEGSVIECVANGQVVGEYEIPQNHFVTLDSKTPLQWFNLLLVFEVKDSNDVQLRIRRA
jgi:hypothetical protein